jgi:hypothetical protein
VCRIERCSVLLWRCNKTGRTRAGGNAISALMCIGKYTIAHLVEEQVAQAIMNQSAFIEFHFERRMHLASAGDDCTGIGDWLKII